MNRNTYKQAVEHLEFYGDLYSAVMEKAAKPRCSCRIARVAALAAVMVCMLATTAFAVSPEFRNWTISLFNLGTSQQEMTDAQVMEFRHDTQTNGVSVHYLELDKANYSFVHGMISSPQAGYLHVTEDYRLESVETSEFTVSLEKNGKNYTLELDYFETDAGVISWRTQLLQKNHRGEVFLNPTDGNSHQWPVYVNLETGEVRDALPAWTADDFPGRVTYAYELMDGFLISILVDEDKVVNGNDASYNMLYWIAGGAEEAVVIDLPWDAYGWYCENNELYYRDGYGRLYRLNEDLAFDLICDYATGDDLTNGLYTVATENNELAIVDVYSGDTYVIPGYTVDPGRSIGVRAREGGDIDETMGYNAIRYNADGRIALVQTELIAEEKRVALRKLGILEEETGELKLLEIENDYDGYHVRWLDENRLAVIYDEKYLCIYEFE